VLIRRVVTGRGADGASVIASDAAVEPVEVALIPDGAFHPLWGVDDRDAVPADGRRPAVSGFFPPPGGFRFVIFTVAPDTATPPAGLDRTAAVAELDARLPGFRAVFEPGGAGFHTTDTIDVGIVLSGELVLELDPGHEVTLRAGDTFVQNGTRHAWRNRASQPSTVAVTLIGARP
jgi:Cupin domain